MYVEREQLERLFVSSIKNDSQDVVKLKLNTMVELLGFDFAIDSYVSAKNTVLKLKAKN